MSGILIALGFVVVGFVGGLIGRKAMRGGTAVTPTAFNFRFGEVEAEGLQDGLLEKNGQNV